MDTNNVTDNWFSHASSPQKENADKIFTSEKVDTSSKLVDKINNFIMKDAGYELNKTTKSDIQGDVMRDPDAFTHTNNGPDTITHTSNGSLDQK